ncbi:hypothetical protein ACGC1H_002663 [Rhizoctonia solani]
MHSATRPSFINFMRWAILSFLILFPNAVGAKYKDAQEHSTGLAPNAISLYGPVNTNHYYTYHESTEHSDYVSKQESYIVWDGCFVYGMLCIAFITWFAVGYARQRPCNDEITCRLVGRTLTIATGCEPKLPDGLKAVEASPISASGSIGVIQARRGKQCASQGPDSSPPPTPTVWDMKEPRPTSDRRRLWMSPLAIEDWTERSPVGQERKLRALAPRKWVQITTLALTLYFVLGNRVTVGSNLFSGFPMIRYPVQASFPLRANARDWESNNPFTLKPARRTPYLCLANTNLQPPHRGSTPNIVETRLDRKSPSLEVSLYGNPRLLRPGLVVWFILVIAFNG